MPCKTSVPKGSGHLKAALFGDDFQVYFVRLFYVSHPRSDRIASIAAIAPQFA